MNKITPILTNQRVSPYRTGTSDKIQLKTQVFSDNKRSSLNISNIPVELYLNYSGDWALVESGVTNNQGIYTSYHDCGPIPNIPSCLAKSISTINNSGYVSNITRINFKE